MLLPRIPRIQTKIGEICGQVFSVVSVQNSVAKNLCFCEKDLTVSGTNSPERSFRDHFDGALGAKMRTQAAAFAVTKINDGFPVEDLS